MPALPKHTSRQVFTRDGWKCRYCASTDALHPHHIIYQSQRGPDEMWNLITLCAGCHDAHHRGFLDIIVKKLLDVNLIVQFVTRKGWRPQ